MKGDACLVSAVKGAEVDAETICAILSPVVADRDGARIEVSIPAAFRASARVVARDGAVLAEGGVSISDRDLDRGSWEKLAAELKRQMSSSGEA